MDPFRADYYSFWDPQNWPKLSPAPKTDFCRGKILEEGNFFDENYELPAFSNEKIKDAGRNFTHNGVLVAPPSIL